MTADDRGRRRTATRRTWAARAGRGMLLALAIAAMAPAPAAAEDVTFTLKNCADGRKKIDVRVYDRVDEIRMFPVSGWSGMDYQQVVGFRCVRRKPADPNECTVVIVLPDSGMRQDHSVANGNAVAFCLLEPTRTWFDAGCSC